MADQPNHLRQFQSQVIAAAADYPAKAQTWIALAAGSQRWLMAAEQLSEVLVSPACSAIGSMPAGVLGIVATRGKVFTVLDMPRLLADAPPASGEAGGWLVALSPDLVPGVALWWPELTGIQPSVEFHASSQQPSAFSSKVLMDADGHCWQVLDVQSLMDRISGAALPDAQASSMGDA